ncbi:MAG: T9SS type A sorting domain-containing protein, partial [Flavobacteriales bacterium]
DPGYVRLSTGGTVFAQLDDFNQNSDILQFATDVAAAVPTLGGQPSISVYQNPASTDVTITGLDPSSITSLSIVDATGRVLRSTLQQAGRMVLDVQDLPSGLYVLNVANENGRVRESLVIAR